MQQRMINHTIPDQILPCTMYMKEDKSMTFYFGTNTNEWKLRAEQWKNTRESWNTMNSPGNHLLKARKQFPCLINSAECTFLRWQYSGTMQYLLVA